MVSPPPKREVSETGTRDRASVWRPASLPGVEILEARYRSQHFRPHAHEGFLIGLIESGAHSVWCRGVRTVAAAGTVATMCPGEVHHGGAGHEAGWRQFMLYVPEHAVAELVEDASDRRVRGPPAFGAAFRLDRTLIPAFLRARATLAEDEPLALQTAFEELVLKVLSRHARSLPPSATTGSARAAIERAREYLAANLARPVRLAELAGVAHLRRRHFIALFKKRYGLPPHAYLVQLRIEAAKVHLARGLPPGEVAAAVGFSDQSHLNRHFRAIVGTTPGRYAQLL